MTFFTSVSAILLWVAIIATIALAEEDYLNVYGEPLQSCSQDGMALTGWTRNGHCVDHNDDSGSHHICINLSSTTNGKAGDFCQVTGQPNWCSSHMPCHQDGTQSCLVQNWCVCEWAFARYLRRAGGCHNIQEINCHAINRRALEAYTSKKGYDDALACLVERCELSTEVL